MKTFISIFLSISLVAFCYYQLQLYNNITLITRESVKESTSVESVIEKRFSNHEKVILEEPKVEDKKKEEEVKFEIEKHLEKKNDDYLGSISIPVIGTSEAIYRSKGEYYLDHSYQKKNNKVGEVYLDDRTGDTLEGNGLLLNGHAVPNGSKFGSFKKLLTEDVQPLVHIYNHDKAEVYTYKMLFVSLIDGANSGIIMNFNDSKHRSQYYRNLYDTSIKKWEAPSEEKEYLLLNSCAYIIDDGRYVVIAERIN